MRVVLHVGLRGSGAESLQYVWCKAFGVSRSVWYPRLGAGASHASLAADLPGLGGSPSAASLVGLLGAAVEQQIRVLLLSSDDFADAEGGHLELLRTLCEGHDLQLLLTITPPESRWPDVWERMVRRGWGAPQGRSIAHVDLAGTFGPGALEGLVRRWAVPQTAVCLVPRQPAQLSVSDRAADAVALQLPERWRGHWAPEGMVLSDVEARLLCEFNRLVPGSCGLRSPEGRAVVKALRGQSLRRSQVGLDPEVAPHVARHAITERKALEHLAESGLLSLHDPDDLLSSWDRVLAE